MDVVVRGGLVADGTGAPAVRADVLVADGRIVDVGTFPDTQATQYVDASGCVVMPGFIDAHVHGDALVTTPDVQLAALRQGVTTFVLGQDGVSFAPSTAAALRYVSRYFSAVNGRHPALDRADGVSVAALLDTYDRTTAVNSVYLAPLGTVRAAVVGTADRPATADELAAMTALVKGALDEGAAGVSSGLEYVPGGSADVRELAALSAPAARRGLPYVTHMRGYESRAPTALAEACEIGRTAGVPLHVSHYHGPGAQLAGLVDEARASGLDLTFDSYPYLSGSTVLAMVVLPPRLKRADPATVLRELADGGNRRAIIAEWAGTDLWARITLSHVPDEGLAWTEGMTLADAAARAAVAPEQLCVDLLRATGLEVGCVFAHPATNSDESVRLLLRHPAQVGGSDGIYVGGHPHPRGWGAFARLLGRHVRELGDWTWEQAAAHLARGAADRFGLTDRGRLTRGTAADVVVVEPDVVTDVATYADPRRPAVGVRHVLVNGVSVLSGGELTGALPGRPLRPGAAA